MGNAHKILQSVWIHSPRYLKCSFIQTIYHQFRQHHLLQYMVKRDQYVNQEGNLHVVWEVAFLTVWTDLMNAFLQTIIAQ
jgi:hypothetical protein